MTTALPRTSPPELRPIIHDEPVVLLQLSVTEAPWTLADAASSIYREFRLGRSVVAIANGPPCAASQLEKYLDVIGVSTTVHNGGVGLIGEGVHVVAGREITRPSTPSGPARLLRVALAGRGVVGGGILPRLRADARFDLVGVLVRDPTGARDVEIPPDLLLTDAAALLAREPDVVIEAISDASTGLALMRAALARGVHIVSASKQAIAADPLGLEALANASGATLAYSAAVGGGVPAIETVMRARAHGEIMKIEGVLNGTCNFVLSQIEAGATFIDALAAARGAGFAELDPSADLSGLDAAAKLSILAKAAGYALPVEAVRRQPLTSEVDSQGLRQLACFDRTLGIATVSLQNLGHDPLFRGLAHERNALRVTTVDGRCFVATGRGAGRSPTCESVWADLLDLV